ncbi:hypothetical protein DPMN_097826 [Dreissena polymorpha]|uniref:Uncharacterized protein n=1 Tax=Dreissena polymorpha TaxID=45954 RepID=A0A9D4LBV0_DREPO|nr:hypothetical protein DPMN_115266 [Dreissena polymorpha]KAH3855261.1 hypothetical protein DPMN_097826 [Dreissena polymorpha]
MNLLTEFHEDRTINVASREKCPPFGSHIFQANVIIFELIQDINKTNLLTIFHEDWTINVASRVLTRKNAPPPGGHVFKKPKQFSNSSKISLGQIILQSKNAPPPGGHVFQPTGIIFELLQDIIGMNLLTKFHEDWTINVASRVKNAPPLGSHFHEDRKINVASRVLTRKNAPPLGSHVFQANVTIFKLLQDIIETNLLTKFHEDWTINVASRVFTRQMLTTDKRRSQKLTMSTLCSGELKKKQIG